ncbi:MAG: cold shock domain-containing protein [bacterium]
MVKKGQVKWFDERKGYGFIRTEDQEELFVHASDVNGYKSTDPIMNDRDVELLYPGESVEFEIESDEKGQRATDVWIC